MNKVQDKATLDEKTVQKIAAGEHRTPRKRRQGRRKKAPVQPTYESPLVHAEVWAAAKKILDGGHGYTKWEVLSETEVVVR